jgi:hypothetical protein
MENMINLVEHIVKGYLLKESLSSVIYHYTLIPNLSHILISECFELTDAMEKGDYEYQHPTKRFFMCFTRQKNSRLGYAQERNVRLTIDGDLLNSNYEGHPIDYFAYMIPNKGGKILHNKISPHMDNLQKNVEAEDRLFSNQRYIKHIERYIKRIDILVDEYWRLEENEYGTTNLEYLWHILQNFDEEYPIFVYNNRKDFDLQNNNTINDWITEMTYEEVEEYIEQNS